METDHSWLKPAAPEERDRMTGTWVNQVDLRVSRTKYAKAWFEPYWYFSISSKVARSINPLVIFDPVVVIFKILKIIFTEAAS